MKKRETKYKAVTTEPKKTNWGWISRLRMVEDKGDNVNKKRLLTNVLIVMIAIVFLATSTCAAFWLGRLTAALAPVWPQERLMCVAYRTDLRTEPTGYVISHIEEGAHIWYLGLDLPFAGVAYYNGDEWLRGTLTAAALEPCISQQ